MTRKNLDAVYFGKDSREMTEIAKGKSGDLRPDRFTTFTTRLYLHLKQEKYTPAEDHKKNPVELVLPEVILNDLKMSIFLDLNKEASKQSTGYAEGQAAGEAVAGKFLNRKIQ